MLQLMENENELLQQIKKKKREMVLTAELTSLRSEETVKCSQELDNLLNTYQQIILNYETLS
jgi:stage 0 sporulation regulatory protein